MRRSSYPFPSACTRDAAYTVSSETGLWSAHVLHRRSRRRAPGLVPGAPMRLRRGQILNSRSLEVRNVMVQRWFLFIVN